MVFKRPLAPGFQIKWRVAPYFADEFSAPAANQPGLEPTVTLAQGLSNGRHMLEIVGDVQAAIAAIRIYRPPLR